MKPINIILEIIGWLQITCSITAIAGLIALAIYLNWNSESGKIVSIAIITVGFVLGAIWATRIWIKHGTVEWISRNRRIT